LTLTLPPSFPFPLSPLSPIQTLPHSPSLLPLPLLYRGERRKERGRRTREGKGKERVNEEKHAKSC